MSTMYVDSTYLKGLGKVGKFERDAHGFCWICVGAFDTRNSAGEFYKFDESIRNWFEGKNDFTNLLHRRQLKGEWKHPEIDPKWTNAQVLQRVMRFEELLTCVLFADFKLTPGKDEHGKPCVLVMARLKETGYKADAMAAALDNVEENVAFSIRCFSRFVWHAPIGEDARIVTLPITFDHVNRGGIHIATKFDSPTYEDYTIPVTSLDLLKAEELEQYRSVTCETLGFTAKMIRTNLGWQKVQVARPLSLKL